MELYLILTNDRGIVTLKNKPIIVHHLIYVILCLDQFQNIRQYLKYIESLSRALTHNLAFT